MLFLTHPASFLLMETGVLGKEFSKVVDKLFIQNCSKNRAHYFRGKKRYPCEFARGALMIVPSEICQRFRANQEQVRLYNTCMFTRPLRELVPVKP